MKVRQVELDDDEVALLLDAIQSSLLDTETALKTLTTNSHTARAVMVLRGQLMMLRARLDGEV